MAGRMYRIDATSKTTGRDVVLHVEAVDAKEAASKAIRDGWLVSSVDGGPVPELPDYVYRNVEPPKPDATAAALLAEVRALRADLQALQRAGIVRKPLQTIGRAVFAGALLALLVAAVVTGMVRAI